MSTLLQSLSRTEEFRKALVALAVPTLTSLLAVLEDGDLTGAELQTVLYGLVTGAIGAVLVYVVRNEKPADTGRP